MIELVKTLTVSITIIVNGTVAMNDTVTPIAIQESVTVMTQLHYRDIQACLSSEHAETL